MACYYSFIYLRKIEHKLEFNELQNMIIFDKTIHRVTVVTSIERTPWLNLLRASMKVGEYFNFHGARFAQKFRYLVQLNFTTYHEVIDNFIRLICAIAHIQIYTCTMISIDTQMVKFWSRARDLYIIDEPPSQVCSVLWK